MLAGMRAQRPAPGPPAASPYRRPLRAPPRLTRVRSPTLRAGLVALVLATLPFAWSEDFTCGHAPQPSVTGLEILFGRLAGTELAALFFTLFAVTVGLGFLAWVSRHAWRRLAAHVVAALAGTGGTTMCLMIMGYGRSEQPLVYPAAWIGTFAAGAAALEAWVAAVETLRYALARHRAGRAPPVDAEAVGLLRVAVGAEAAPDDVGGVEEEAEEDDPPASERRARGPQAPTS
jgi:hypothetical protein